MLSIIIDMPKEVIFIFKNFDIILPTLTIVALVMGVADDSIDVIITGIVVFLICIAIRVWRIVRKKRG